MSTTTSQQFEGSTIEEAINEAVISLGDDLEIQEAQRVMRRSMLGLRRLERFEVTAVAKPTVEPKGFDDVLRRMVDRVDEAESAAGSELADTDLEWWRDADFAVPQIATPSLPDATPSLTDFEVDVRLEPARAKASPTSVSPVATACQEPASELDDRLIVAGVDANAPDWSSTNLLDLDLPGALVARVKADESSNDLAWIAALTTAIAELLQTADGISGPCELTGHGAESAVHLVRGACDGFKLDSLIIDGRRVPATPLELALAIRALLRDAS